MIAPNNCATASHFSSFNPHSCLYFQNFPSPSLSSSLAPHHPACSLSSHTHLFLILPSTGDSEPLQHVRKAQQVTLSQHHSAYLFWAVPGLVIANIPTLLKKKKGSWGSVSATVSDLMSSGKDATACVSVCVVFSDS